MKVIATTPQDDREKITMMAKALADQLCDLPPVVVWAAATLAVGEHPLLARARELAAVGRVDELVTLLQRKKT